MNPIADIKRETSLLVRSERDKRLDRKARDARDGLILDAFDRLEAGRPLASEESAPSPHQPQISLVEES